MRTVKPSYIIGGMQNGAATLEIKLAVPQNVKYGVYI